MKVVVAPDAISPLPCFSQAILSNGFVFCSGIIGCVDDGKYTLVEGGVQAQTRAALQNVAKVLAAAGTDLAHVVKVTVYLTEFARDFKAMNEAYEEFFEPGRMPARATIGAYKLTMGADFVIDCIAELPQAGGLSSTYGPAPF